MVHEVVRREKKYKTRGIFSTSLVAMMVYTRQISETAATLGYQVNFVVFVLSHVFTLPVVSVNMPSC